MYHKKNNRIMEWLSCLAAVLYALLAPPGALAEDQAASTGQLRIFTCGHSFHYWMPPILSEIEAAAGIPVHQQIGRSGIGGSKVIQHWEKDGGKNEARAVLEAGKVDVPDAVADVHAAA